LFLEYLEDSKLVSLGEKNNFIFSSVTLFFICILWIPELNKIEFIGEFPSALFVCGGTLLIFFPRNNKQFTFLGGCLLGLAVQTKLISLILVVPVYILWLIVQIDLKKKYIKTIYYCLLLTFGIVLPSLLFELYKLSSIGYSEYLQLKSWEFSFFKSQPSGLFHILDSTNVVGYVTSTFSSNLHSLLNERFGIFYIYLFLILLILTLFITIIRLIKKIKLTHLDFVTIALVTSALVFVFWWLFIYPQGSYRHLTPAITVISFTIILCMFSFFKNRALIAVVLIMFIWLFISPSQWISYFQSPIIPSEMIKSTQETSEFLSKLKSDGEELLGCGWWANRRLEYFMPGNHNFNDCFYSQFKNSILVIDEVFWNWDNNDDTKIVENRCSLLLYNNFPYKVYKCN
jgi:hypothetical protein